MSAATNSSSGVKEFYKNKTILLTGSTGYLGIILLEKLIRSFPEIKKIIVIIRSKRGKSSRERLDNNFDNEIFEYIRNECPSYLSKVVCLKGEISSSNCGLQSEDIQMIHNEVDFVIHSAATIKFNEVLKTAVNINVRGTLNILELSKGISNLKSFIYISTIYNNCNNTLMEEIVYTNSIPPENLLNIIDNCDDGTVEKISKALIGSWPNSYTFTKNSAENLVYSYRSQMPVVIFRPAIITGPYKEPIPGWINKMYMGPYGWFTATGLGLNRIIHMSHPDSNSNIVPSDYVAHAIIAVIWDVGVQRKTTGATVINYTTTDNPISWNSLNRKLLESYNEAPFANCSWYPMSIMEPSLTNFRIRRLFLQRVPAYVMDLFMLLMNKEPKYVKLEIKLSNMFEETWPFLIDFNFPTDNINTIWNKLSEEDKKVLQFNTKDISWDDYFEKVYTGIKKYLLKEPMTEESLQTANVRHFRLRVLDGCIKFGLVFLAIVLLNLIYTTWFDL